ncbi:MAG: histidine phosphatase family protein [Planctomycetota bacterium]
MLPEVTDFCRLFVCRHPELAVEADGVVVGSGEARLGRRGQDTVLLWLRAFGRLRVDAVFAADRPQCQDPAEAIAMAKGLEVAVEERLRDQDMGSWQGRRWDEIARDDPVRAREFFAEFGAGTAPGGESLGDAVERMLSWWNGISPALAGKAIVAVAPGGLISGFATAMLGMRLSRAPSLSLPHGGIGVLDLFANGARVSAWNALALAGE